jgi:uncharacterized protein YqgC (DUF456 family)
MAAHSPFRRGLKVALWASLIYFGVSIPAVFVLHFTDNMRDFQYAYSEGGAAGLTGAIVGQILGQFFGSVVVGLVCGLIAWLWAVASIWRSSRAISHPPKQD